MALQKINWTQIDSEHVPSGSTVDIGQFGIPTSVDGVHTNELSILGVDFFDYLIAIGYTGSTPNTISVEDNSGLKVTHQLTGTTLATTYNTTLESTLATPATVGGIPAGTTVSQLSGKTFVEFVDELLFPIVLPTYTIPTIAITGVSSQIYEVGREFASNLSVSGSKNDAGTYSQLRILRNGSPIFTGTTLTQTLITSIADQFGYSDPNNPNYSYKINTDPYSESYVIPLGSTVYNGDGNYNSGLPKQNNKGGIDVRTPAIRSADAPQAASNFFISSIAIITGIYPYFYGTSLTLPTASSIAAAIVGGTATKVLTTASGTLSIPYNNPDTWLYVWFAYQNDYTTKTKWYVNAFDNGEIDNSFISTAVTQSVDSPQSYWSGITFKMHWSVYLTQQNTIEFRNI